MGRLSHTLMSSGGSPILTCGHPDKQDCGVCFVLLLTSAQRIVLLLSLTPVSNTRWCSSVLCLLQRGKECCRTAQVFSTQSIWDAVQRGCMGGGQRCCLHVRYSPPPSPSFHITLQCSLVHNIFYPLQSIWLGQ